MMRALGILYYVLWQHMNKTQDFFAVQQNIISNCASESLNYITPGFAYLTYNSKDKTSWIYPTFWGSTGYFSCCVIREEVSTYLEQNLYTKLGSAIVGGASYSTFSGWGIAPGIFMSIGYSIAYNYLNPLYPELGLSHLATMLIEISTNYLFENDFNGGVLSGKTYVIIGIAHDILDSLGVKKAISEAIKKYKGAEELNNFHITSTHEIAQHCINTPFILGETSE